MTSYLEHLAPLLPIAWGLAAGIGLVGLFVAAFSFLLSFLSARNDPEAAAGIRRFSAVIATISALLFFVVAPATSFLYTHVNGNRILDDPQLNGDE